MDTANSSYLHIPTIPVNFIQQMVAHLDTDTSLDRETHTQLQQLLTQTKITIEQYTSFFRQLGKSLDDEMLGFLPRAVPLGSQATLCHLLYHSPDLVTALENFNRFYNLFLNPGDNLLDLSALQQQGRIILNPVSKQSQQPMFQQTVVLALLKIPAWLSGQKISLDSLQFNFEVMPFDDEFNYLFGVVPNFSAPQTQLQYSAASLNYPIAPNESAAAFGSRFIEYYLYWAMKDDIVRHVYAEISHRLLGGEFDVTCIAQSINASKHTLARRLKARGSSYSQILERVRRDKAIHLLLNSAEPIELIAEQLGFKEFGSFSRAFKYWTGLSPRQYRERGQS